MEGELANSVARIFPRFADQLRQGAGDPIENVLPPASVEDIEALEKGLGIVLPDSYKMLLRVSRGFWLCGGVLQFGDVHPFFHEFESFESLTPAQQRFVEAKGGDWPPPTQGMLCFAEYFAEADGDQVLFDVSEMQNGEYPIVYWAHERHPPAAIVIADSFAEWLESCLDMLEDDDNEDD